MTPFITSCKLSIDLPNILYTLCVKINAPVKICLNFRVDFLVNRQINMDFKKILVAFLGIDVFVVILIQICVFSISRGKSDYYTYLI